MTQKSIIITLGLLLVATGGYFGYNYFLNKSTISPWDIVPKETVLVYESSGCDECMKDFHNSAVASVIKAAAFSSTNDSISYFSDFIFSSKPGALISLHVAKSDDFDFVFYVPINQKNEDELRTGFDALKGKSEQKVSFSEREYDGVKIQEMTKDKKIFSWFILKNIWVGSFTPILVEDVIRTYQSGDNFKTKLGGVQRLAKIKNDGGNVYVNLNGFAQFISLFTKESPSKVIQKFGQSAMVDVKQDENQNFILNGFTQDSTLHANQILSVFKNQKPVPFLVKGFVSNRTILFTNYGISDGALFFKDLKSFNEANHFAKDTLSQLAKSLRIDLDKFRNNLVGEVGVSWVESKKQKTSQIVIISTKNETHDWLPILNTLSEKLSIDTIFYEKYSDYEIRELPLFRFPEKIFSPLISGFDNTYFTQVGNVILLAEDLDELKLYLDDIDKEETWGKSVSQNKFLETTLLESNISVYINTNIALNVLTKSLQPRWQEFVHQNQSLLSKLNMGAIQFSHLNDSYYTNISWSSETTKSNRKTTELASSSKIRTNLNQNISKFSPVRNYQTKGTDILVQDDTKAVHLISTEGSVLWTLSLDDFIQGDVLQVDYFNNGKLQYLFATAGQLHIVDRLGKYVAPFPIKIAERNIEYLSVVDYDHSKKYRFLITGKSGKLWMYDKEGKNLDGWNPNALKGELCTAPQHHRIRGKDYIVMIQRDGNVSLMNRRGEMLKNFPIDLNARPEGGYFLETGKGISDTYFVVVSRDGFRIKFNLDGKIQSRETLLKNNPEARFALVVERNAKSYLIARQEAKRLTLFDDELKEKISNDFIGNNAVSISYSDFGAGRTYLTLTDLVQDLSFVYTLQGKSLSAIPIESHAIFVTPMSNGKINACTFLDESITIQPL
ncbi:MAG TPA: hypothetical protein PLJ60_06325 [Chryseolinea sp.]|nr:hypothetical protein [Chryseolinea sp.]